jgi:hypothetical protein
MMISPQTKVGKFGEPWEADGECGCDTVRCHVDRGDHISMEEVCFTSGMSDDEHDPFAARIASCVNAMRGIDDPEQFLDDTDKAIKSLLDIIHDDLTHARQDDHIEALRSAGSVLAILKARKNQ